VTIQRDVRAAARRAVRFLAASQRPDGTWIPIWFGNEDAPEEDNPAYGTARVLLGLHASLGHGQAQAADCRRLAVRWLLEAQNADGGWGGSRAVRSSIEETGVVLAALGRSVADGNERAIGEAVARGAHWLADATVNDADVAAAPLGLYFARLWYYEDLYPVVFALAGLAAAGAVLPSGRHAGDAADRFVAAP
jgi:squalene-hopene/tetraprenyl-beta-curcumene cyclase